jgi:cation transporter-like permease
MKYEIKTVKEEDEQKNRNRSIMLIFVVAMWLGAVIMNVFLVLRLQGSGYEDVIGTAFVVSLLVAILLIFATCFYPVTVKKQYVECDEKKK